MILDLCFAIVKVFNYIVFPFLFQGNDIIMVYRVDRQVAPNSAQSFSIPLYEVSFHILLMNTLYTQTKTFIVTVFTVTSVPIICPSSTLSLLALSLALLVCPAVKAYISVTIGWILIKLGESVGTKVQLVVLKLYKKLL